MKILFSVNTVKLLLTLQWATQLRKLKESRHSEPKTNVLGIQCILPSEDNIY